MNFRKIWITEPFIKDSVKKNNQIYANCKIGENINFDIFNAMTNKITIFYARAKLLKFLTSTKAIALWNHPTLLVSIKPCLVKGISIFRSKEMNSNFEKESNTVGEKYRIKWFKIECCCSYWLWTPSSTD